MIDFERQASGSMIGTRLGAYVVQRKLGEGAMGEVYLAVHEEVGQRAAVKVMRDDLTRDRRHAQRFFAEARVVSMLEHPGLVKLFDFRQLPDGRIYLLMEYLAGETLGERLRVMQQKDQRHDIAQALRIARQVASVLREVHGKGVVHRDLKPDNLMLVADPDCLGGERVKLLDFGIAKLREGERLTHTDAVLGTPRYMSPEQCRAEDPGPPSDIYSLGALLYELLAGQPPFNKGMLEAIMFAHMTRPPRPLRELNPALPAEAEALVARMLAKDPAQRPDAAGVLQALDQLLQASEAGPRPTQPTAVAAVPPVGPSPERPPSADPAPPASRAWPMALVAALGGAALAWGVFARGPIVTPSPPAPPSERRGGPAPPALTPPSAPTPAPVLAAPVPAAPDGGSAGTPALGATPPAPAGPSLTPAPRPGVAAKPPAPAGPSPAAKPGPAAQRTRPRAEPIKPANIILLEPEVPQHKTTGP